MLAPIVAARPTPRVSPAPTITPTEEELPAPTDDGDHDRFAHYVRKSDAAKAYIEGIPVRALCGKVWVPSRDPSKYPVCPDCAKIREQLLNRGNN